MRVLGEARASGCRVQRAAEVMRSSKRRVERVRVSLGVRERPSSSGWARRARSTRFASVRHRRVHTEPAQCRRSVGDASPTREKRVADRVGGSSLWPQQATREAQQGRWSRREVKSPATSRQPWRRLQLAVIWTTGVTSQSAETAAEATAHRDRRSRAVIAPAVSQRPANACERFVTVRRRTWTAAGDHGGPGLQHGRVRRRSTIPTALIGRSGYLEGIVRGFRAGLLTQNQYRCVRARRQTPI